MGKLICNFIKNKNYNFQRILCLMLHPLILRVAGINVDVNHKLQHPRPPVSLRVHARVRKCMARSQTCDTCGNRMHDPAYLARGIARSTTSIITRRKPLANTRNANATISWKKKKKNSNFYFLFFFSSSFKNCWIFWIDRFCNLREKKGKKKRAIGACLNRDLTPFLEHNRFLLSLRSAFTACIGLFSISAPLCSRRDSRDPFAFAYGLHIRPSPVLYFYFFFPLSNSVSQPTAKSIPFSGSIHARITFPTVVAEICLS